MPTAPVSANPEAPEVPNDQPLQEDDYEEPKWASIRNDENAGSSSGDTPSVLATQPDQPSQSTEDQENESASHAPTWGDLVEHWTQVFSPLFAIESVQERGLYSFANPNVAIEVRHFFAMPTRLAHIKGLDTMPIIYSPVVWVCEIQHWSYTIYIRSFCDSGPFNSRLLPKFVGRARIEYPEYTFVAIEHHPREVYGPFVDGEYTPPCTSPSCTRCASVMPDWFPEILQPAHHPSVPMVQQDMAMAFNATPQPTVSPAPRHIPANRTVLVGRNGHEYIHAPSQHAILEKDELTGQERYKDLKNIMILTMESLEPSLEDLKSELEAKGWEIDSCSCIPFPKRGPGSRPVRWRTFISFFEIDHANGALEYLNGLEEHGSVKFVTVDHHKPRSTLMEKPPCVRKGRIQQSFQQGVMA